MFSAGIQSPKEIEERLGEFVTREPELSTFESTTIRKYLKELQKMKEDLNIILDGGFPQFDVKTEGKKKKVRGLIDRAEEQILLHEQFLKNGGFLLSSLSTAVPDHILSRHLQTR